MDNRKLLILTDRLKRRHRAWQFSRRDQYRVGREMFVYEGMLFNIAFNLTWGIFLAGFLKYIGISDALNGFIAVLPALVGVVQPLGAYTIGKAENKKKLIITLAFIQRMPYSLIYFIPIFITDLGLKTAVIVILILVFHFLNNFNAPTIIDWLAELAPANIRGKYFSVRDIITVLTVAVVNLGGGFILDYFKGINNPMMGFTVIGIIVAIAMVGNMVVLSNIYEPPSVSKKADIRLNEVYIEPFKDKIFRRCIFVGMIWSFAFQFGIPYLNVYFVSFLRLDFTFIMAVGLIATFERLLVIKLWLKLAEKKSWTFVTQVMLVFVGITYFAHAFINIGNAWWLYVVLTLILNIPWTVIMAGLTNLQFDHAPDGKRAAYIGCNAAAQGIAGFIGGVLGAMLMSILGRGTVLFLTAPQILILISGSLMVCSGLYVKYYIRGNDVDGNAFN